MATNAFGDGAGNVLVGNDAANLIGGYAGNDWIEGRGGKDWLSGGTGADRLDGGADNDTIEGQLGTDTLFGGAGADAFFYGSWHDSNAAEGIDSIRDFQHGADLLVLAPIRASAADQFSFTLASGNIYVAVDLLGDGYTDMIIEVIGQTITTSDVVWG